MSKISDHLRRYDFQYTSAFLDLVKTDPNHPIIPPVFEELAQDFEGTQVAANLLSNFSDPSPGVQILLHMENPAQGAKIFGVWQEMVGKKNLEEILVAQTEPLLDLSPLETEAIYRQRMFLNYHWSFLGLPTLEKRSKAVAQSVSYHLLSLFENYHNSPKTPQDRGEFFAQLARFEQNNISVTCDLAFKSPPDNRLDDVTCSLILPAYIGPPVVPNNSDKISPKTFSQSLQDEMKNLFEVSGTPKPIANWGDQEIWLMATKEALNSLLSFTDWQEGTTLSALASFDSTDIQVRITHPKIDIDVCETIFPYRYCFRYADNLQENRLCEIPTNFARTNLNSGENNSPLSWDLIQNYNTTTDLQDFFPANLDDLEP